MLTKIDLCSMALLKLGEKPIQSFLDDNPTAQLARTLYSPVTDALLALHPWKFATRFFDLTKNADGDFLIPADCLRILRCHGEVMGNRIISSAETVSVLAVMRISAEFFPAHFISVAAAKLAMEFCIPLTGDQGVFRMLAASYESELQSAKFTDSTVAKSSGIENFSLIETRF